MKKKNKYTLSPSLTGGSDRSRISGKRLAAIIAVCLVLTAAVAAAVIWLTGGFSPAKPPVAAVTDTLTVTEAAGRGTKATEAAPFDVLHFDTPAVPDDGVSAGHYSASDSGTYIYAGRAMELFGGYEGSAKDYAAAITEFSHNNPDLTVYSMVVPVQAEFVIPQRLIDAGKVYTNSQRENIRTIYESYPDSVRPINCYNTLCAHMDEYLYFRTDHHWTGLGAYYAYRAFCEQTGQQALKLKDCEEKVITGFEGTLSGDFAPDSYEPDEVHYWRFPYETHAVITGEDGDSYEMPVYYEDIGSGSSSYLVFIYGDYPLVVEYNDELKSGKKIAVVKESFANAFVPYLTNNYQEVHVIDSRYFDGSLSEYMTENGIGEVLFLNNEMAANSAGFTDGIRAIY